jgi:hypothetical protein
VFDPENYPLSSRGPRRDVLTGHVVVLAAPTSFAVVRLLQPSELALGRVTGPTIQNVTYVQGEICNNKRSLNNLVTVRVLFFDLRKLPLQDGRLQFACTFLC